MTTQALTDALQETLSVFETAGEPGEPLTTQEVTDHLDISRRSTYARLERLVEHGLLLTKKAGARGRVWWRPPGMVDTGHPNAPGGSHSDEMVETMLGRLIDNLPGMVYRCKNEAGWPMSYVSDGCSAVSEYDAEAIESGTVSWGRDVIHPRDRERVRDVVYKGLAENGQFAIQYRILTPDDETRWVWERGCAVDDEGESTEHLEGVILDVTDQRESEQALTHRDEQFRALVDATEEYAIFMLDREGHVTTWNPGAERIKGFEKADIVGEHFSRFYTDEDRAAGVPERNLERAREEGKAEDEGWRVRKDGSTFWANVTISAIRDEEGDLQGFAKVTRDMTERHEYEEQLKRERDLVDGLFETSPVGMAVFGTDWTLERANARLERDLGIPVDEGETYSPGELPLFGEDDEQVPESELPISRVFESGESVYGQEMEVRLAEGERRWVSVNATPFTDEDGEISRVVVTVSDVTTLKEQARQLRRQRDDVASELEEVFQRVDDAFIAMDENWRVTYVNEYAADMVLLSTEELLGERVWDAFPEMAHGEPRELAERAMDTQESVEFEHYSELLDIWVEVRLYPSESGLSVYFRDVTERKQRERELEESRRRYRTLVENFPNGAVTLVDENLHYQTVGGTPPREADATIEELEGRHIEETLKPTIAEMLVPKYRAAFDGESSTFEAELGEHSYQFQIRPVRDDDGEVFAALGMSQDVTERREREEELELYETIVDTIEDGVYVLDEDFRFTQVNDAYVEMTGYDREELLGAHAPLVVDDDVSIESADMVREVAAGERQGATLEADIHRKDGSHLRAESRFTALPSDDAVEPRKVGVVRDVSERVERERELENRVRQQQVVADLGQHALEAHDIDEIDELMAEAAEQVAETLDNDYCKVLDLDPDRAELLLRQGVGWQEGIVGSATVSAVENDSQAAYTLANADPIVVENLETETRFSGPDLLTDHDVRSGISTIIGPYDEPWGILGTHDRASKEFSDHDVAFVQSVANILATAIERYEHEEELFWQREQLEALNNLNEVVRDSTEAVIDQSTREEVEQVVCEALAASDSYLFAWTGEVDGTSETVNVGAEAGVEGYLDGITISVDPEDPRSEGPTGRALRTGEIQTSQNVKDDERHDPWREHVEKYGFRSSAAIPLVHEETVYGVLNVYAGRPYAFEGEEREVVGQLGEIVGHAIAAVERKRALMSDELVELEFRVADVFETVGIDAATDGRIVLEETVPVKDDEYLVYGHVTEDARESVNALVETLPQWTNVTFQAEEGDTKFELHLSEPPVLSTLAALGGSIDEAVFQDGDYHMTLHLSPSADVRRLIDAVQDAYPTAEMLSRRQISRTNDMDGRIEHVLAEDLTDRQRTALRAAYHADFFEWPRETTGEAVADSLDVSPPTFHQHLRKAEKKVFDSLLSDGDPAAEHTV